MRTIWVVPFIAAMSVSSASRAAALHSSSYITYELRGEDKLATDGKNLESIAVFSFELTPAGDVVPHEAWVPDTAQALAANPGGRTIVTTVVNHIQTAPGQPSQVHNGDLVHMILSDPARRAEHVRQIVDVARLAHGVELDYERLRGKTRDYFTQFVAELRAALPVDKKLFVVLPPKTDNQVGDGGRAIDWRAIEPYVDQIRVMAYYYSWATSPHGPPVTLAQLDRLARYAMSDPAQGVSREKLRILLSFYGWDWPMPVGTRGLLITYDDAMAIAAAHGITPTRDPVEGTLHFTYVAADGIEHEIWIDDVQSQRMRIDLLQGLDFPHIDFWHLNTGDRRLWDYIAANTVPLNPPPPPPASRAPSVDFDADGAGGSSRFRPSTGAWLVDESRDGTADLTLVYGRSGDIPVAVDFDGDGATDLAVFRPSTHRWFIDFDQNGGTDRMVTFGAAGDVPVPGDYDGDGAADVAMFRPGDGSWHFDWNEDGLEDRLLVYGKSGDIPVPADYDGDGRTDIAVFRPSTHRWFVDLNLNGGTDRTITFGASSDVPVPGDYDGDGAADVAMFRPSDGSWHFDWNDDGIEDRRVVLGQNGDVPVAADYDGDGITDVAVYRRSTGGWMIDVNRDGIADRTLGGGAAGDVPLRPNGWIIDALGVVP